MEKNLVVYFSPVVRGEFDGDTEIVSGGASLRVNF
tara:strand:+ start:199 stop:303 length:105 start_codon:yes stop_codon:yes gene_type:complete